MQLQLILLFKLIRNAACDITIDNIKIKRLNGDDTPRIDYTDGGCPVLLTEPQSTNFITQSNDFSNSSWNKGTNTTLTYEPNIVAPDGNLGVYRLQLPASSSTFLQFQTGVGNKDYTGSIYAKKASTSDEGFNLFYGGSVSALIVPTDNWHKYDYTDNGNSFSIVNDGDVSETDIYIWGAQLEELPYATSLIPTYGAVRTRLQDTVSGAGTSSDFNSEEGVLFAEVGALNEVESKRISLSDGTNDNRVVITLNGSNASMLVRRNGVTEASMAHTVVITDLNKIAVKYKENDFALWVNGVEVGTDNNGLTFPINTFTQLSLADGTSGSSLFGKTSQVQVFKTALSDHELELLTTDNVDYASYATMASFLNYNIS